LLERRYQEALEATREAVSLHRALAADNPAAHQPRLAGGLNNLGIRLDRLGRHQEALAARTESVRIFHELASRSPDLYQAEYRQKRQRPGPKPCGAPPARHPPRGPGRIDTADQIGSR